MKKIIRICVGLFLLTQMGGQAAKADRFQPTGLVDAIAWSPDGTQIAFGTYKGEIIIFDTRGHLLQRFANDSTVSALRWSPDGKTIASGDFKGMLKIWDPQTGLVKAQDHAHDSGENSITWSPDGTQLAGISNGPGYVAIWTISNNKPDRYITTGDGYGIAWSPDGSLLAITGPSYLKFWDVGKGVLAKVITLPQQGDYVAWSPDGSQIAVAEFSTQTISTIQIWDSKTGSLLTELKGHTQLAVSVEWSPDGKKLVSGGYDNTARVWDAGSGKMLAEYQSNQLVNSAAWSPFGGRIAYAADVVSDTVQPAQALKIVVPPLTKTDLQAIVTRCVSDTSTQQSLVASLNQKTMAQFIDATNTSSAKIPAGCLADIQAVAQSLQDTTK